ncbi:uncharacterized protein METZ01_LOCUS417394, partial [marine metagenome]
MEGGEFFLQVILDKGFDHLANVALYESRQ